MQKNALQEKPNSGILDDAHLSRQTMGDGQLADEILGIFMRQCENCVQSLSSPIADTQAIEIAHLMKGCAKSVGAWQLAQWAKIVEENPVNQDGLNRLSQSCVEMISYLKTRR